MDSHEELWHTLRETVSVRVVRRVKNRGRSQVEIGTSIDGTDLEGSVAICVLQDCKPDSNDKRREEILKVILLTIPLETQLEHRHVDYSPCFCIVFEKGPPSKDLASDAKRSVAKNLR